MRQENVVIVGSGPAGLTAAIYTGRAGLAPFMFEGFSKGGIPGGQLMTTTEVENFPGFPDGGISGPELMMRIRKQAMDFGLRSVMEDVEAIEGDQSPFIVRGSSTVVEAKAVIIATGATARRLHVPSEERLWNNGISACAVCDGALPRFRDQDLVVIGGGDSACEEALYLTRFASKVFLVHRRDQLRASRIMAKRVLEHEKIEVIWNHVLEDAIGESELTGVRLKHVQTGETREIACAGLFYAIGHKPNTDFLIGKVELDDAGYIIPAIPGRSFTSCAGIFACGDVVDKTYRQAITAAGSGCAAALDAERWLSEQE
ncbi:MAG: thioredoxin-disulfide reductase [Lentisphaerae bacterium]|nr:MAG: thioredoxin-disulfide reductase [Lentisphaerota bacterium]